MSTKRRTKSREKPTASQSRASRRFVTVAIAVAIAAGAWGITLRSATDSGVAPLSAARISSSPAVVASGGQTAQPTAPAAKRQTPAAPAAVETFAPAQAGQRVSIDPATGRLRPIEHDDAAKAAPAGGARRAAFAAPAPEQRLGPDGSVLIDVPEDLHTFTVATRTADGKTAIQHATWPEGAAATARAKAAKGTKNGAKEALNDR